MTDYKKQGKASRDKGKRGELQLMHILRDEYGYDVRRGKVFYGESDLVGFKGVHIECKAVERLNIREALRQAIEEAQKRQDGIPVVFSHKNRDGWIVAMRLEDFMDFYGAWEANDERD